MNIYYIDQDVSGLLGEYLTEAMIVAESKVKAIAAALSLASEEDGFGIIVERRLLTVIDCGKASDDLLKAQSRWTHENARIFVVGTGFDSDIT